MKSATKTGGGNAPVKGAMQGGEAGKRGLNRKQTTVTNESFGAVTVQTQELEDNEDIARAVKNDSVSANKPAQNPNDAKGSPGLHDSKVSKTKVTGNKGKVGSKHVAFGQLNVVSPPETETSVCESSNLSELTVTNDEEVEKVPQMPLKDKKEVKESAKLIELRKLLKEKEEAFALKQKDTPIRITNTGLNQTRAEVIVEEALMESTHNDTVIMGMDEVSSIVEDDYGTEGIVKAKVVGRLHEVARRRIEDEHVAESICGVIFKMTQHKQHLVSIADNLVHNECIKLLNKVQENTILLSVLGATLHNLCLERRCHRRMHISKLHLSLLKVIKKYEKNLHVASLISAFRCLLYSKQFHQDLIGSEVVDIMISVMKKHTRHPEVLAACAGVFAQLQLVSQEFIIEMVNKGAHLEVMQAIKNFPNEQDVQGECLGALVYLSVDPSVSMFFYESGAHESALTAMKQFSSCANINAIACAALRDMTVGPQAELYRQSIVPTNSGHWTILDALHTHVRNKFVVEQGICALCNLSVNGTSCEMILDSDVLKLLLICCKVHRGFPSVVGNALHTLALLCIQAEGKNQLLQSDLFDDFIEMYRTHSKFVSVTKSFLFLLKILGECEMYENYFLRFRLYSDIIRGVHQWKDKPTVVLLGLSVMLAQSNHKEKLIKNQVDLAVTTEVEEIAKEYLEKWEGRTLGDEQQQINSHTFDVMHTCILFFQHIGEVDQGKETMMLKRIYLLILHIIETATKCESVDEKCKMDILISSLAALYNMFDGISLGMREAAIEENLEAKLKAVIKDNPLFSENEKINEEFLDLLDALLEGTEEE
eukprot:Nk52_evm2s235 gene=Nk52_evmTU2s235